MRVTSLGHAALYIETGDQRVLIDPVFAESLAGGALVYHPARQLDLDALPKPTALVLTHGHFDHFHADSLLRLDRTVRVFAARDEELLAELGRLGFEDVRTIVPWERVELGETLLVPTPSEHEEPEFGLFVGEPGASFWHMADSEVTEAEARRLHAQAGAVDVVSVKFQPVVRASMGQLRGAGSRFDPPEVVRWLEAACVVEPRFAFPYASGLCFSGRHAWFNRYAFPLAPDEAAELLRRRLGRERSGVVEPGDVIAVERGRPPEVQPQASPFVKRRPSASVIWEPVDTSTLEGLESDAERAQLEAELDAFIDGRLLPWLRQELAREGNPWRAQAARHAVWQLIVEAGGGARIERHLAYASEPAAIVKGRHPYATSFTHVSGRALADVLAGKAPGFWFWLAGDARSYAKPIWVEGGRLRAEPEGAPEDEAGDPLTFFLRRWGPTSLGEPTPTLPLSRVPAELDALTGAGENAAVLEKKALLALLAGREAERRGLVITDETVQATSDEFRATFGLSEPERTLEFLKEVGLDLPTYTRVMRAFAAVRAVQAACADELAAFTPEYAKVASVRRRKP